MDVSVIVVTYNSQGCLTPCLLSVADSFRHAAQGRLYSHETLVVDNASQDDTVALVRREFPEVRVLVNEANRGFAAACNQGMEAGSGRYFLILNADAHARGPALPLLVSFLDEHPRAAMASGSMFYPDGSFQHSAFRFPTLAMALLDFFPMNRRLADSRLNGRYPRRFYNAPFSIDHPLGACMMVCRAARQQTGGMDEDFFMYCEEVDWCLRLRRAGWGVYCVPEAEIVHLSGHSTLQFREQMFVELWRSRFLLFRKHYSSAYRLWARAIVRLGTRRQLSRLQRAQRRGEVQPEQVQGYRRARKAVLELMRHYG